MTSPNSHQPTPPSRPVTRGRQIQVALSLPPVRPPEDVTMASITRYLEEVSARSRLIPLR